MVLPLPYKRNATNKTRVTVAKKKKKIRWPKGGKKYTRTLTRTLTLT